MKQITDEQSFQNRVARWTVECFGEAIAMDCIERNHRFLEESLELVQANGCTQSEAYQLVDYVFGREMGHLSQKIGGVALTLAALCNALGMSIRDVAEDELSRVYRKIVLIRAKQAVKPKHSPLPHTIGLYSDTHQFQNFHRVLCERFNYGHDPIDFRRDQVSLIEHIAERMKTLEADNQTLEVERDQLKSKLDALREFTANLTGSPDVISADKENVAEPIVSKCIGYNNGCDGDLGEPHLPHCPEFMGILHNAKIPGLGGRGEVIE